MHQDGKAKKRLHTHVIPPNLFSLAVFLMIENLEMTIPLFRINIIGTSEYVFRENFFSG